MFGEFGNQLEIILLKDYRGFLLAILPPGAFLGLGFLIAGINIVNARREKRVAIKSAPAAQPAQA
jgi:electron transport complex protein RnfE